MPSKDVLKMVGESLTISASASGGRPPYKYQWYHNNSTPISEANGGTSPTLQMKNLVKGHSGSICLQVSDTQESVRSPNVSLSVSDKFKAVFTFSHEAVSSEVPEGAMMTFGADLSGGTLTDENRYFVDLLRNGNRIRARYGNRFSEEVTASSTASGVYQMIATGDTGERIVSPEYVVTVKLKPFQVINNMAGETKYRANATVSLTAKVWGDKPPTKVEWFHVKPGGAPIELVHTGTNFSKTISELGATTGSRIYCIAEDTTKVQVSSEHTIISILP